MATVLAYTSPAAGHAFPAAGILTALQARGHRVIEYTVSGQVDTLNRHGIRSHAIDSRVESIPLRDWQARTQPGALRASVRAFVARAAHDGPDLQRAIAEHAPDMLLVDINSWGALAAAERWGGPWAAFCPYPLAMSSHDAPPFGLGLRPAAGLPGTVRDAVLRPVVYAALGRAMLPGVNTVRTGLGLPVLRRLDDQFRRPPLLLYLSAPPFEYPRADWPENLLQVGPCEWEPTDGPRFRSTRPMVLVTTSSEYQGDQDLLHATAWGLADEDVDVVLTAPSHGPVTDRPANAISVGFAAHGPLLDHAVCAVTHAGMGATQKALARGVPVVAVPYGRDQFEVARRVEVAGAGVRLSRKTVSPARLRAAVAHARTLRAGAQRVAEGYRAAGQATAAAAAIEAQLRAPSRA